MKNVAVQLLNAGKEYKNGDSVIVALQPSTVSFQTGELTLIIGPSGSGKTTLLSLIGCVIYPTSGEVWIGEQCTNKLSEKNLGNLRLSDIGFIFQGFNLLAPLNALENVMQPLILKGYKRNETRIKAKELLQSFDMVDRMYNLPKNLSGGQQQRTAIARAIISEPKILLCDEPTASLDQKSAKTVMDVLRSISHQNKAVVVVTHDMRLTKFADRTIYVSNGRISYEPIVEEI